MHWPVLRLRGSAVHENTEPRNRRTMHTICQSWCHSHSDRRYRAASAARECGSCTTSREETAMSDTSVTKVNSAHSPKGAMGQKYLASGIHVAMRLWEAEAAGEPKPPTQRDYETVGYVISGRAELHREGQMVLLAPGDSWVVPRGSTHSYRILEPFTAIEATSPPAHAHARDE